MIKVVLNNQINSIEISYLFAKNLKHGVNSSGQWQLFEPSKFIYTFFTLNMIYDIEWNKTFRTNKLCNKYRNTKTSEKIYELIKFIYTQSPDIDFYMEYKNVNSINKLYTNSKKIVSDPSIDNNNSCKYLDFEDSYFNNYLKSVENLEKDCFDSESHYHLIAFCNQIRNNIFHGSKTVGMMTLSDQRERLKEYTDLLLITIELFFQAIESNCGYFRAEPNDLDSNISI